MTELRIMRGLPGSGKTTIARTWVASRPASRVRVSRDDLREQLFGAVSGQDHRDEELVTAAERAVVVAALRSGRSVVVDDTNLRARYARAWADLAITERVGFGVDDVDTPVDRCVDRDFVRGAAGGRLVGEAVIRGMAETFGAVLARWPPVTPSAARTAGPPGEGASGPGASGQGAVDEWTYTPAPGLPEAWLVDVDGTLALVPPGGRSPHDASRYAEDLPNGPVVALVRALAAAGSRIVVTSGREDGAVARAATAAWLDTHGVPVDRLVMRAEGDHRADSVVKLELLRETIAPAYRVVGAVDDRQQVVDAWRRVGLVVAQVAPGDF